MCPVNNDNNTVINIPAWIGDIVSEGMFTDCKGKIIIVGPHVKKIASIAFKGASFINIEITENIEYIREGAFQDSLTNILNIEVIANCKIMEIAVNTFKNCTSLSGIFDFPSSVQKINAEAF